MEIRDKPKKEPHPEKRASIFTFAERREMIGEVGSEKIRQRFLTRRFIYSIIGNIFSLLLFTFIAIKIDEKIPFAADKNSNIAYLLFGLGFILFFTHKFFIRTFEAVNQRKLTKALGKAVSMFTAICDIVYFYGLMFAFGNTSCTNGLDLDLAEKIWNGLYMSVITWTTVGYGDCTPEGIWKGVAAVEGMMGILLNALFTAVVVVVFVQSDRRTKYLK